MTDAAETEGKVTTADLMGLLRAKYERGRYALLFDVPDAVSTDQRRRIDAIAVDCWRSGGRTIEGFELKISRGDWLREMKQVDKADPFVALCDRFWLVTGDSKIAKLEEIPACWGWMAATKGGLRVQRPATPLPGSGANIPRAFLIGVLRKLQDALVESPDVRVHIKTQLRSTEASVQSRVDIATMRLKHDLERLQAKVREFEEASGIKIEHQWGLGQVGEIVGQLKRLGFGSGLDAVPNLLTGHANALRLMLENIEQALAGIQKLGK